MTIGHDAVMDALDTALSAAPVLFDGGVSRNRGRALPEAFTSAVNIRIIRSDPEGYAGVGAPIDWVTRVGFECIAKVKAPSAPDGGASAVLAAVHTRLTASSSTFEQSGFEFDPAPTLQWDQDDSDERIGAVIAIYNVRHRTNSTTLS